MEHARFGPAGNSLSFGGRYKSFLDIPKYVSEMGLDAFEYQFGRGVRMRAENAVLLKAECEKYGVEISAHAPYYISFASEDGEKRLNSVRYMLETAEALAAMGGKRFVVHCGSAGKRERADALSLARQTLLLGLKALDEAGYSGLTVCPETMGLKSQLGSLRETLYLCEGDERLIPCVDFGHLNARSGGGIRTKADYAVILDELERSLGAERARTFHAHFSKIEYSEKGERRHLTFADTAFGPDPRPLMELAAERRCAPRFICESAGTQAEDARAMREMYEQFLNK